KSFKAFEKTSSACYDPQCDGPIQRISATLVCGHWPGHPGWCDSRGPILVRLAVAKLHRSHLGAYLESAARYIWRNSGIACRLSDYQRTQLAIVKSRKVLNAALRSPKIKDLP